MPKARLQHTKPVAFHVTRQEYERLQAECAARGARSLAELVRAKVLRGVHGNSLAGVADQLDQLEQAVQQLSEAIHSTHIETSGASHGR
jgi:flagellar biosynthesis chaperone FliJ